MDIDSGELFRRYFPFVSHFVMRMGVNAHDVDDLAQEVFLIAHRKGGYVAGAASPKTWLARTALGVVSTHKRSLRRRREDAYSDVGVATAAGDASPADVTESREALARVQRALDKLDFDQRAVFVLYEFSRQSCEEIATALEVPVGTVYSRLHTARSAFLEAHRRLLLAETRPPAHERAAIGGRP